jgi:hypothetical protein
LGLVDPSGKDGVGASVNNQGEIGLITEADRKRPAILKPLGS